jgi:hypothetical protein
VSERFVERTLREPKRRAGNGCPKDVKRSHGEFEPFSLGSQQVARGHSATVEAQGSEWMGRDHVDPFGDGEAWGSGINDEATDA